MIHKLTFIAVVEVEVDDTILPLDFISLALEHTIHNQIAEMIHGTVRVTRHNETLIH